MIKLHLSLPCPLNRRFMPVHFVKKLTGGKSINLAKQVLSKEYRQKQERLVAEIWKQCGGRPEPMTGDVQVCMVMTPRDRRTADIDAYAKAILDGLVKASVIKDDKQVVHTICERLPNPAHPGGVDVTVEAIP